MRILITSAKATVCHGAKEAASSFGIELCGASRSPGSDFKVDWLDSNSIEVSNISSERFDAIVNTCGHPYSFSDRHVNAFKKIRDATTWIENMVTMLDFSCFVHFSSKSIYSFSEITEYTGNSSLVNLAKAKIDAVTSTKIVEELLLCSAKTLFVNRAFYLPRIYNVLSIDEPPSLSGGHIYSDWLYLFATKKDLLQLHSNSFDMINFLSTRSLWNQIFSTIKMIKESSLTGLFVDNVYSQDPNISMENMAKLYATAIGWTGVIRFKDKEMHLDEHCLDPPDTFFKSNPQFASLVDYINSNILITNSLKTLIS